MFINNSKNTENKIFKYYVIHFSVKYETKENFMIEHSKTLYKMFKMSDICKYFSTLIFIR